jgi:N4-(beta-N-acetylglucosaminyl)-L-asparaginase
VSESVPDSVTRRDFLGAAVLAVAGSSLPGGSLPPAPGAPWVRRSGVARLAAVGSDNGIRGVKLAVELMTKGTDTLDAGVEGVKIQELDPTDDSVGFGGLPNEDGVVQLDASCVHGPTRRAGAVAALEGIKTPSEVARLVLKYTDHILLVGDGAKRFALSYGFKEEDLLTPASREKWLRWRANRSKTDSWTEIPEGQLLLPRPTGTINLNLINEKGELSSITTTSGLAWKVAGRAGDSPIVGAGQYTDNAIGAAGSTGLGELNIMVCGGFLTVEHMRQGMSPTDAALATLKRVVAMCPDTKRDTQGRPPQLSFYALNKRGEYGAASIFPSRYAACDDSTGPRSLDTAYLYPKP